MQLMRNLVLTAGMIVLVTGLSQAALQEQGPPMPKPGPEHDVLKADVGTWDAKVEVIPMPGAEPVVSKGVEINTLGCGGLCLITDFKAEFSGQPFHGHGLGTWDPAKNKYVGSWTDSMSQGLAIGESAWDPAKKQATGTMEMKDPAGQVQKMRTVVEYPSSTSRVMTSYMPGPDGKEFVHLRISYTKRQ